MCGCLDGVTVMVLSVLLNQRLTQPTVKSHALPHDIDWLWPTYTRTQTYTYTHTHLLSHTHTHTLPQHSHCLIDICLFRSIFAIHTSFRVLALAEPPLVGAGASTSGSSSTKGQQWLGPELLTMFLYHTVRPLARAEEVNLLQGLVRYSQWPRMCPLVKILTLKYFIQLSRIRTLTEEITVNFIFYFLHAI